MRPNEPRRPDALDPLAVDILERLRQYPEAEHLILGGHFALKHYLDYRPTHDVDAWWQSDISESTRQALLARLRAILVEVAGEHGLAFRERRTGTEVVSLELREGHKAVFTLQIAARTVELERPIGGGASPWSPIPIETLADNVGAKMNALVNRGAPRDFVDIYTVVTSGIVTVGECWDWWQRKNPTLNANLAKAQVIKHLESIELRRQSRHMPPAEREAAERLRRWFRETLARLVLDDDRQGDQELDR